jgi:hypothetical protein
MYVRSSRLLAPLLLSLAAFSTLRACSGTGTSTAPGVPPIGGGAGIGGGTGGTRFPEEQTTEIPDPNLADGGAASLDARCGVGDCVPDDSAGCEKAVTEPPSPGPGDTASGGAADGGAGSAPAAAASGSSLACRVVAIDEEPASVCRSSGSGELDAPCLSTDDCGTGFACVGGGLAGRCRPYCCRQAESCESFEGTYCSPEPQREGESETDEAPLIVPVCVSVDDCDLGEAYPCPAGHACECGSEKACMVVRSDRQRSTSRSGLGMTACVEPGAGKAGEPCPCDWGHVCSRANATAETSGTCLELCSTLADKGTCSGRCQASTELPLGWGVCISR